MRTAKTPFLTVTTPGNRSVHEYTSDAAAVLGDLWSRIADLDVAQAALDKPRSISDINTDLVVERYCQMLWIGRSGSVRLPRRCFSSGLRNRLQLDLEAQLDGETKAAHELLLAVANKHLAHSVNPFEEVKVAIVLDRPEGEAARVVGVTQAMTRLSSHNEAQLQRFTSLVAQIRELLLGELNAQGTRVATEAAHVPVDELVALLPLEFRPIDDDEANRRR